MNKIVHLCLFLAIVSAVAGGALAFANQMTAPVIAENNERQEKESLLAMYPDANSNDFKLVNKTLDSKTVQKVYEYKNVYIFNMNIENTYMMSLANDLRLSGFNVEVDYQNRNFKVQAYHHRFLRP